MLLLFEFILYKNLDKIMPTYENKLYSFENEITKNKKNFYLRCMRRYKKI